MILLTSVPAITVQTEFSSLLTEVQSAAVHRDAKKLSLLMTPGPRNAEFLSVLVHGGPYFGPMYPWKAVPLRSATGARYIVLSTPVSVEDVGEGLFEVVSGNKLKYIPEDFNFGSHITGHEFWVRFDQPAKVTHLQDTVSVSRSSQASPLFIRIAPNFGVSNITEDNRSVPFEQAGGILLIHSKSQNPKLTITYSGTTNDPRFGGFFRPDEVMLTDEMWFPNIARQPAPYKVHVVTPIGWTAVAQGELEKVTPAGPNSIWTYDMALPCCYYSLSIGNYAVQKISKFGKEFRAWSNSLSLQELRDQDEYASNVIHFYEQTFCPLPFSGYGAMLSKNFSGDWLEAYSFATYNAPAMPVEDPHEPSHSWWGGIMPNTYLHSLWNESFADYSEGLYRRNVKIGNLPDRSLAYRVHPSAQASYRYATLENSGIFAGAVATEVGYGKGAEVLWMLEQEIGTELMEKSIRKFLANRVALKPVEWSDFELAVNEATGKDYGWFFDEWAKRPGFLDFSISAPVRDGAQLRFNLKQSGAPFRFRLPYSVRDAEGKISQGSVEVPATPSSEFDVSVPANGPVKVQFDPRCELIRLFTSSEQKWISGPRQRSQFSSPNYAARFEKGGHFEPVDLKKLPDSGTIYVMPGQVPEADAALARSGINLDGTVASFHGETVDLTQGAAYVVDGSRVWIFGTPRYAPNVANCTVALADDMGRFLAGDCPQIESGAFTFSIP